MTEPMPLLQFFAIGVCWGVVMVIALRLAWKDAAASDEQENHLP